jgi:hypothetical protein
MIKGSGSTAQLGKKITGIDSSILSFSDSKDTGVRTQPLFDQWRFDTETDRRHWIKDPDQTPNHALFASIFQDFNK